MAKKLILYVEDQPSDVGLIKSAFYDVDLNDWEMTSFGLGQESLDYLFGQPPYENRKDYPLPDLVLLDLNLPDMHGLDVLRKIKSSPLLQAISIAVFTSSEEEADEITAAAEGITAYFHKPSTYKGLVLVAEKMLAIV